MVNYVLEYADKIRSGEIITSKRVAAVYQRLADEIRNPGKWIFDEKKAQKPLDFIARFCKHSKGEWMGQPVQLELFQAAFVQSLYGFLDADTGLRRFNEAFFHIGRKNGKTTLAACLALYGLIVDEEGAGVYFAANRFQQANLGFSEVLNMVSQSPELAAILKKRKFDLSFPTRFGTMQPLASKSSTMDGLNISCCIYDECHENTRETYEVLKQAMSARRQPIFLTVTTSGTKRGNIYDDLYEMSCRIADGTQKQDDFLPILYELDTIDEWQNPEAWIKANPGLHTIKKVEDIVSKVQRAAANRAELPGLLTKDFNIRMSNTMSFLQYSEFATKDTWKLEDFRGCWAVAGVDLGSSDDLCSASIMLLGKDDKKYVYSMSWLPSEGFEEHCRETKVPYDKWLEAGLLRLSEGNLVDYDDVQEWFLEVVHTHGIAILEIGFDPWNGTYFEKSMKQAGFNMTVVRQGAQTLSEPLIRLGQDFRAKRIQYNCEQLNPLFEWACCNVGIKNVNGAIIPQKATTKRNKIDPFASALNSYVILQNNLETLERFVK